jgi:hypothetical protein
VNDDEIAGLNKKITAFTLATDTWRFLISRLFKINNVLLDHQGVTTLLYQLFLLIEFLQMLYYVFYKVDLYNEFIKVEKIENKLENPVLNTNSTLL